MLLENDPVPEYAKRILGEVIQAEKSKKILTINELAERYGNSHTFRYLINFGYITGEDKKGIAVATKAGRLWFHNYRLSS